MKITVDLFNGTKKHFYNINHWDVEGEFLIMREGANGFDLPTHGIAVSSINWWSATEPLPDEKIVAFDKARIEIDRINCVG